MVAPVNWSNWPPSRFTVTYHQDIGKNIVVVAIGGYQFIYTLVARTGVLQAVITIRLLLHAWKYARDRRIFNRFVVDWRQLFRCAQDIIGYL